MKANVLDLHFLGSLKKHRKGLAEHRETLGQHKETLNSLTQRLHGLGNTVSEAKAGASASFNQKI